MKLNCDLGEGLDEIDTLLMPHIDMASIACGGHAGNTASMARSIALAKQHHTSIGAHPSYPDRENFGRLSLDLEPSALFDSLCQQIKALTEQAHAFDAALDYIKPHGALYNDAWKKPLVQQTLLRVAAQFSLPLVVQAKPGQAPQNPMLIYEAFADRSYTDDGRLVARSEAHAVHRDTHTCITQAKQLYFEHGLYSENGQWLTLLASTLCVHSDSPAAVETVKALRLALSSN